MYLQGPRQSGKSTLAQSLRGEGYDAEYFTLDDAGTLAAAQSDPDGFVSGLPERVILDEVQRVPELFRAIKRSVDAKRKPGRFLLTGSAQALVLPKLSESLAGRMEVLTLWPFSQGEIAGRKEGFVDACFAREFKPGAFRDTSWPALAERIATGGYPEVLARTDAVRRQAWFGSYITTILERDVRDLANVTGLRDLPRLLRLAASRAMGLLNFADLSRDAAMPQTTMQRYWALFEATFLVRSLPPWHANLGLRLVKTPKVLLGDTGLLCHMLGLDTARLQADDLMTGAALECFVAGELTKQISWSETRPGAFSLPDTLAAGSGFCVGRCARAVSGNRSEEDGQPNQRRLQGLAASGGPNWQALPGRHSALRRFNQRGLWTKPARRAGECAMAVGNQVGRALKIFYPN